MNSSMMPLIGKKEYDEERVKKKVYGAKVIQNFSAVKINLAEQILKAIRTSGKDKSIKLQIQNLLRDNELLESKGLYDLQEKVLNKAKQMAEEREMFPLLLEILEAERKLLFARNQNALSTINERINKELDEVIKKLTNKQAFINIRNSLFVIYRTEANMNNKEKMKAIHTLMQSPLLQDERAALTSKAKLEFYNIHAWYCRFNGNNLGFWKNSQKRVNFF